MNTDSFQLRLPAINDTRTHIPWLDVSYTVNQLIWNPVGLASGEYIPQAGGLPLTTAERDGTWELHFTPDHDGYAMFYVGSRPTYNWGTPSSQVSNINYVECNAGDQSTVTFDALMGNRLYFIYYPVDTSVLAKVSFDDSYFIS